MPKRHSRASWPVAWEVPDMSAYSDPEIAVGEVGGVCGGLEFHRKIMCACDAEAFFI